MLEVFEKFMVSWAKQDWKEMLKTIQESQIHNNMEKKLENYFGHIFITNYEIVCESTDLSMNPQKIREFIVKINCVGFGEIQRKIRLIFEDDKWGINPIASLRPA